MHLPVGVEPPSGYGTLSSASTPMGSVYPSSFGPSEGHQLLPSAFPSEADTLAYVDALKHSNFSQWRSLEEVAKHAGGGSCSGAMNTSVLTALYLLGLFNLCAASPASCCVPPPSNKRKKRSSTVNKEFQPLFDSLQHNLSSISLDQFNNLPHVSSPDGGRIPIHISVVEQVRKLWGSNPRLLSNIPCSSPTAAVRSSFISLSGVASGIILAYSIAQLNQCYPDQASQNLQQHKTWFFPIPPSTKPVIQYMVRSLPTEIPVSGEDDPDDGCDRLSVRMVDGRCAKLLSADRCPYMHWVLINRDTRKGECAPKICPDDKIFVEADQMCHDVNEPNFCPENQRLYLTAWGEAVCDCIDGMFPGADGNCHRLYESAYCDDSTVLQFHRLSKTLICKVDPCDTLNQQRYGLPFARAPQNGICYKMSTVGPCDEFQKFGYDIETLSPTCVSLEDAGRLRPHRSFQYSHMSFPSAKENGIPHYEVSYVILNGSTWELMMRTVGRQKRDTPSDLNGKSVVRFLDTREFPLAIQDTMADLKELEIKTNSSQETKERTQEKKLIKTVTDLISHKSNKYEKMSKKKKVKNQKRKRKRKKRKRKLRKRHKKKSKNKQDISKKTEVKGDTFLEKSPLIEKSKNEIVTKVHSVNNETYSELEMNGTFKQSDNITISELFIPENNVLNASENETSSVSPTSENSTLIDSKTEATLETRISEESGKSESIHERNYSEAETILEHQIPVNGNSLKHDNETDRKNCSKTNESKVKINTTEKITTLETPIVDNGIQEFTNSYFTTKNKPYEINILQIILENAKSNINNTSPFSTKNDNIQMNEVITDKPPIKLKKLRKKKNKRKRKRKKAAKKTNKEKSIRKKEKKVTNSTLNPFADISLPDYLKNRGRRQAAKKRFREIPGIINAPLLNQCRPGAKRDYNGHCRPKIIMEIFYRHKPKKHSYTPTYPRIKCADGTRLDSRGTCRRTFSGLG